MPYNVIVQEKLLMVPREGCGTPALIIAAIGSARVKCQKYVLTNLLYELKLRSSYLLRKGWCFSYVILHISAAYDSSHNCSLRIDGNNYVDRVLQVW